jgi:hypothetical protein
VTGLGLASWVPTSCKQRRSQVLGYHRFDLSIPVTRRLLMPVTLVSCVLFERCWAGWEYWLYFKIS